MPQLKNKDVPEFRYRTLPLVLRAEDGKPATLDEKTRSVEVTGATETPVPEVDFKRMEIIPTVLLVDGMVMPTDRQLVLLDTHERTSTRSVIGSYRGMRIVNDELIGRAHFSKAPEAESPYTKLKEGHLKDFSISRLFNEESTFIEDGETRNVNGRNFSGPIQVVTKWTPRELSITPVGADPNAKVRADMTEPVTDKNLETNHKEDKSMPDPKDNNLTDDKTRSAPPAATEPVASPPAQTLPAPVVDEDKIRADAVTAERQRTAEITALCDQHDLPLTLRAEMLGDGTPENRGLELPIARERALAHMADKSPATGFNPAIEMGAGEKDKFRSAAVDSLFLRSGIISVEKPAPGAVDLRGLSLREMCREALRVAGQKSRGDIMEMIQRALTTSDLPNILSNVANKFVLTGFETAEETWRTWCSTGSVADFKQNTLTRASETQDLDEILEDGEYKYDKISDKKEVFTISTYGKIMRLSRQAIINDDLGQLTNIPMKHGESAARKIGDIAYTILTANAAMGDTIALFAAAHNNVGTAGIISEVTAAEAIKLMKQQKDIAGLRRLNITPIFYIAPVAVEGTSEIFFNSGQFAGAATNTTRNNPYAGTRFTRVYEPRLDDISEDVWYMAGPKGKTVEVFFLNGNETPFTEMRQGFNIDGIEWKVRQDVVAKAKDWVALVRNDPTP